MNRQQMVDTGSLSYTVVIRGMVFLVAIALLLTGVAVAVAVAVAAAVMFRSRPTAMVSAR